MPSGLPLAGVRSRRLHELVAYGDGESPDLRGFLSFQRCTEKTRDAERDGIEILEVADLVIQDCTVSNVSGERHPDCRALRGLGPRQAAAESRFSGSVVEPLAH